MQLSAGMRPDASLHTLKVAEGKISPRVHFLNLWNEEVRRCSLDKIIKWGVKHHLPPSKANGKVFHKVVKNGCMANFYKMYS